MTNEPPSDSSSQEFSPALAGQSVRLSEWLSSLAERFDQAELTFGHGTDNAWDEAVALTLGGLAWADDAQLLEKPLSKEQIAMLETLARRRIDDRVPVPILIGRTGFAGLEFLTAPNVMIPRSPIAEMVRNSFRPWLRDAPRRVLDVCCGGGCIGISVADQYPEATVVLTDLDAAAIELSQKNVAYHELSDRVHVRQGDLYQPVLGQERFDLIVSNPPYVPSAESAVRPQEFRHEPALAYDGGSDGMLLVDKLLSGASDLLADDGLLVVEVGQWRDVVEDRWPSVPFVWPEFYDGGEGVLVLEAAVVAEHTARLGFGAGSEPS